MIQVENSQSGLLKYNWMGKTILVVEDVETSNMYFKAALSRTNVNILWAVNGLEAIEQVKSHQDIDLILMDIHMPKMNGFEATAEIKSFKKDLKIIMQTAYVLSGEKERSFNIGCDDFIEKPINFKRLLATIQKHI
jgi:two-component system, cell cycle response regulator DivK